MRAVVAGRRVGERFVDALVSVLQLDVLADHRDFDALLRAGRRGPTNFFQSLMSAGGVLRLEQLAHGLVQPLGLKHQRRFVDRVRHVAHFDHRTEVGMLQYIESLARTSEPRADARCGR